MRAACLQAAVERLTAAIRDVETELAAMKAAHDPLASHISISRRHLSALPKTLRGKTEDSGLITQCGHLQARYLVDNGDRRIRTLGSMLAAAAHHAAKPGQGCHSILSPVIAS
jgi:hypothetical protein